jgi:hypothetical protein
LVVSLLTALGGMRTAIKPVNYAASAVMFGAFLLAGIAVLICIAALVKFVWWRLELPDRPEHRRALADSLDLLIDGGLGTADRAAFVDARYLEGEIDQVRRSIVRVVSQHPSGVPVTVRDQLREWTSRIRESAS